MRCDGGYLTSTIICTFASQRLASGPPIFMLTPLQKIFVIKLQLCMMALIQTFWKKEAAFLKVFDDLSLARSDEVVTIYRKFAPYRGYYRLIRAVPKLVNRCPNTLLFY